MASRCAELQAPALVDEGDACAWDHGPAYRCSTCSIRCCADVGDAVMMVMQSLGCLMIRALRLQHVAESVADVLLLCIMSQAKSLLCPVCVGCAARMLATLNASWHALWQLLVRAAATSCKGTTHAHFMYLLLGRLWCSCCMTALVSCVGVRHWLQHAIFAILLASAPIPVAS
jgi:hypothetical protein